MGAYIDARDQPSMKNNVLLSSLEPKTRLCSIMADYQASSSYDALVQRTSSEDVELTSIISHDSRIHNDNNFDLSDQHESTVSSAEALHQAPDSGVTEPTRHRLLQQIEDAQFSSVPTDLEHRSAMQRIGMYGIIVLAATTILMLAVFSFLTFLWTAPMRIVSGA